MFASRMFAITISAALATGGFAQAPQPIPAPLPASPAAIASDAPVGPRDVIDIKVFQDATLNTRATVADDGNITLNPIGKVGVAGLTLTQIEQKLKQLLERSEEYTSELQSLRHLVCRLLLEK